MGRLAHWETKRRQPGKKNLELAALNSVGRPDTGYNFQHGVISPFGLIRSFSSLQQMNHSGGALASGSAQDLGKCGAAAQVAFNSRKAPDDRWGRFASDNFGRHLTFTPRLTPVPMDFERIEVNSTPPSPLLFSYDSFDLDERQKIVSPTKRMRTGGDTRRSKRQKIKTTRSTQHVPDQILQDPYDEIELPDTSRLPEDGYAEYVAAVEDGVAGFYAISDEIYVAQGWDGKSCCVKVGRNL